MLPMHATNKTFSIIMFIYLHMYLNNFPELISEFLHLWEHMLQEISPVITKVLGHCPAQCFHIVQLSIESQ